MLFHKTNAGTYRRCAGKDYGWYHGVPGTVVVEVWWPLGHEGTVPWA